MTESWKVDDIVWSASLNLEGSVLQVDGDRVQVWWSDDDLSWESADGLSRVDTPG